MKPKWLWIIRGALLVVPVAMLVMVLSCSGDEGASARIIEVVADVDAHARPRDDWIAAMVDMLVYGGGQVRTGADSAAQLELREGTVRLSAYTMFTMEEATTKGGVWLTKLFLDRGRLWINLDLDQPHEFTVETGIALATVRDTRFSVSVVGDTALVSVAEGEVDLIAQGQTVTVRAGEQATAEKGQPPSPPVPMDDTERALWATEGGMPNMAPPTATPTSTPTIALIETPTEAVMATSTPRPTATPTATATATSTPTPTSTATPTSTSTPTRTPTPIPADTSPGDIHIVTDGTWKFSRAPSAGWQQQDYDDSGWAAVDSMPCQEFPGAQPACLWDYPYRYVRDDTLYFRKIFTVVQVPPRARIVTLVDDDVDIYLNGALVLHDGEDTGTSGISWWEVDVTDLIQPGENMLAFKGVDTGEGTAYVQAALGLCFETEDEYPPIVEIMNHWEGWYDGDIYIEAVDAPCDSGVVEVAYRVDGGSWQVIKPHERFRLPPGEHDVEARATDGAGRQGFDSWHFRIGQP